MKKSSIIYIALSMLLISLVKSVSVVKPPYIVIESKLDAKLWGDFGGGLARATQIVLFFLMLWDCFSRFRGKLLKWMGVYRFIVYQYAVSCTFLIGKQTVSPNRGQNDEFLDGFFNMMYNGYFNSGFLKVFDPIKNKAGTEYPGYFHFCNAFFVELIVYLILKVLTIIMAKKRKAGGNLANFIFSLRTVYLFFYTFPFIVQIVLFFKQHTLISDQNDLIEKNKTEGGIYDRANFGYVVGWIIAVLVMIEMLVMFIRFVIDVLRKGGIVAKKKRQNPYRQTPRNASNVMRRPGDPVLTTQGPITTSNQDGAQDKPKELKLVTKGCEVEHIQEEYAFMHVNPSVASKGKGSPKLFYNLAWIFRWFLYTIFSIMFWNSPRTMLTLIWCFDLLFTIYTFVIFRGLLSPAKWLIAGEEILLFIVHLLQFFLFYDQYREEGTYYSKNKVRTILNLQVFFLFVNMVIEFILICYSFKHKGASMREENLNSEDMKFEMESNDELNNRVTKYQTMKTGQPEAQKKRSHF